MTERTITTITKINLAFEVVPWLFAKRNQVEISKHFTFLKQKNAALWNGQVLMLRDPVISNSVFSGTFFPTDYADVLAWRHWDFPDSAATVCFAEGALVSSDGAFLLGVMGDHTAHPGLVHFPSGMPNLSDVVEGSIELEACMHRKIKEETGLTRDQYNADPLWHTVLGGAEIGHFKILNVKQDSRALRARMLAHISSNPKSPLVDIRIVHKGADLDPKTGEATAVFLKHIWS